MLTIEELNNIYDQGVDGPGDPVPKPKPMKIEDFQRSLREDVTSRSAKFGETSPIDIEPYKGYNTEGVYPSRDINAIRGENQSSWDKWGNFVGRTLAKTATGIVEGIGYAGSLLTEWGDDRDYSNGLTESMRSTNQWLDENLPIYRTTNKTWGLGDLGWWLNNAEGLVSSLASFAVAGTGVAKGVGLAGKVSGLAKASEILSGGLKLGQQTSRLLTAGALAYQEGAMMGKGVFDEVYQTNLQKNLANGEDPDEAHQKAKHVAAQSAATSVQLNTMLNTGMNMWSVLPFFNHEQNAIERIAGKNFFQKAGESVDDWGKRVGEYSVDTFKNQAFKSQGIPAMIREAVAEGVEEMTNQFAERTGKEEGNKGSVHGILGQLNQLSKYFDRTLDSEGALNFVMGAIAGPMTNVVTTNIPIHKVQVGVETAEDGTPVIDPGTGEAKANYKLMTSRAKNKFGNTNYFNNIKEAIQEDIKFYQDKHNDIKIAASQGNSSEADRIKEELFNLNNRRAVQLGYAENLKETYNQIASMDNTIIERDQVLLPQISELEGQLQEAKSSGASTTQLEAELEVLKKQYQESPEQTEAIRNGFTGSLEDNSYQQKAKDAIKTLEELQDLHKSVMKKYAVDQRDSEDPLKVHLADFIFDRYASLKLQRKKAAEWEQRLGEISTEQFSLEQVLGGNELEEHITEQKEYEKLRTGLVGAHTKLVEEDKILEQAEKFPTPQNTIAANRILEKYGAIGVTDEDTPKAIRDTRKRIKRLGEGINSRLLEEDEKILNSSGYTTWVSKNPSKSFIDYQKEVNRKYALGHEEKFLRTNLEDLKNRITVNAENLREIETARTMNRIVKVTKNWWEKLANERKEFLEAQKTRIDNLKENIALQEKLDYARLKELSNQYVLEMHDVQEQIASLTEEISKLDQKIQNFETSEEIKALSSKKRIKKWEQYLTEKAQLTNTLQSLTERFNTLQSLYLENQQNIMEVDSDAEISDDSVLQEDAPANFEEDDDSVFPDESVPDDPTIEIADGVPEEDVAPVPDTVPLESYQSLLETLPVSIQQKVKDYELQLKLGEAEFSYDVLAPEVLKNNITQQQATSTLQALKEFIDSYASTLQDDGVDPAVINDILQTEIPPMQVVEDIPVENLSKPVHDSLVTDNTDIQINLLPTIEDRIFSGRKTINAYNSIANMGEEYDEVFNPEKNSYVKIGLGYINDKANKDLFDSAKLQPGTKLFITIDENYDGAKNITSRHTEDEYGHRVLGSEKFEDYTDEQGRIKTDTQSIGNVPIKITDQVGNTVGYLRKTDWITTKYDATAGPEGYRNVYDGSTEEGDIPPGNVMRQASLLLKIRQNLIDRYNRGEKTGFPTEVTSKGAGNIMLNREISNIVGEEGDIVWDRASKLLPDNSLQIGIYQNKKILVDRGNTEFDKEVVTQIPDYLQNRAVFLLPGNNGKYHATIAKGINLMDNNVALNTITRAIELHLENNADSEAANKLLDRTGFDVRKPEDLKAFINQYFTYTTNWNTAVRTPPSKEIAILDVIPPLRGEFNSKVLIGTVSVAGPSYEIASLVRGKLSPEFKESLKTFLAGRLKNIVFSNPDMRIRGINEQVTEEARFIEPRADSKGNFSFIEHRNYNEYIKKNLLVNVNGTNKIQTKDRRGRVKETYVYAVNPKLEYSTDTILESPIMTASTRDTVLVEPKEEKLEDSDTSIQDLFDSMINNLLPTSSPIVPVAGYIEGREVTLENLYKLYNFTQQEDRNGKSVEEVYTYLLDNGITNLYDGFNPFSKCK